MKFIEASRTECTGVRRNGSLIVATRMAQNKYPLRLSYWLTKAVIYNDITWLANKIVTKQLSAIVLFNIPF